MTSPHRKQRFMNGLKNKEKEDKESKHCTVTESLEFTSPPKGKRRRMNLMERFELNETIFIPLPSISPSSSSVSFIPPRFHRSLATPSSSSLSLQEPSLLLPTISSSRHPDLHVITPQTVVHLLSGVYKNQEYKIIDCRFPYEYQGGHLSHAISIVTPMEIKELLIPPKKENTQTMVLIFYCEFSMSRAPAMVRYLRQLDRQLHSDCYPTLYYPQLYLIEGGYKHCFESYQKELCTTPPVYIRMKDQTFKEEYKIQIKGHRQYWKRSISEY